MPPSPSDEWVEELARLSKNRDYKRVADTTLTVDEVTWWVSTVWLGLDHQWGGGAPLIFETMIFLDDHFAPMRATDKEIKEKGLTIMSDEYLEISQKHHAAHDPYKNSPFYEWQCRWATEQRAKGGHLATIAWMLREGPEPKGDYDLTREEWEQEIGVKK